MLRSMRDLKNTRIEATDGDIGHVEEFYFDDEKWAVRYMIVDTAAWIFGRKVLISPYSVESLDWNDRVRVNLTKDQIKESPDVDTTAPISRVYEREHNRYYAIPHYWGGTGMWGGEAYPAPAPVGVDLGRETTEAEVSAAENTHLRSSKEVTGYTIRATDDSIGTVDDFMIEEESWAIRYLVVDTGTVFSGRKVLISPRWVESIDWTGSDVFVTLSKAEIENSPEYDPSKPVERSYEESLHGHYGRESYWDRR